MDIKVISEGALPPHNEDVVFFHNHNNDNLDMWIIDGASSVADRNYIDINGDPIWFAQGFSRHLQKRINANVPIADLVSASIADLGKEFRQHANSIEIPEYAKPIAALTFLRVNRKIDRNITLSIYALGDCTSLANIDGHCRNLDPYTNPQENLLAEKIKTLKNQGINDSEERRKILLPFLRQRRVEQNQSLHPDILCLNPSGQFNARQHFLEINGRIDILLMTDGFYRLVDIYKIYTNETLLQASGKIGLDNLFKQLRDFEKKQSELSSVPIKKADDATALYCTISI